MSNKRTSLFSLRKKGFTLVEVMVAITLFVIVLMGLTGVFLSIISANRLTHSNQILFENTNVALDLMVRHIREGQSYSCGSSSASSQNDCFGGDSTFSFLDRNGNEITYRLNTSLQAIERDDDNNGNFERLTAEGVEITTLQFYVVGNNSPADYQPRVRIVVEGRLEENSGEITDIHLQTSVSERLDPQTL